LILIVVSLVAAACSRAPEADQTISPPLTTTSLTTTSPTPTSSSPTTQATTTIPPPAPTTTTTPGVALWRPGPGTTWPWQLTGTVDTSVQAEMFDIDYEQPASVVADLQARGRAVVCYLSAGSWEDWRPDAAAFPAEVLGNSNGWPGERWLDVRRIDILGPIMEARFDVCAQKGFDGVEVDNIDGYSNNTGFAITAADQIAYNRFLADAAHARGLSIGLKNDVEQAAALQPYFDFAVNEECYQYNECSALSVFIANNKAVFHVEYSSSTSAFCPTTTALGFSSMKKKLDLDAWRQYCP
jgi:hypothetical protein